MKKLSKYSFWIAVLAMIPVIWLVYTWKPPGPMEADVYRCLERGDAKTPIKSYGTNVLPIYIRILDRRPSNVKMFAQRITGLIKNEGETDYNRDLESKQRTVFNSLEVLGCRALPAMPSVIKILAEEDNGFSSLVSMAHTFCRRTKCDEFRQLWISILKKKDDPKLRNYAAMFIAPYGEEARAAIPYLEAMLQKGNISAAQAIVAIDPFNKELVRTLTSLAKTRGRPIRLRVVYLEILGDLKKRNLEASSGLRELLQFRIEEESVRIADFWKMMARTSFTSPPSIDRKVVFTNDDWQRLVLSAIGQVATEVPSNYAALLPFIESTNLTLRLYALNAMWKSTQDASHTLAALKDILELPNQKVIEYVPDFNGLDVFRYSDYFMVQTEPIDIGSWAAAAFVLGQMGTNAHSAAALLERRFRESAGFDKAILGLGISSVSSKQDLFVAALKEILCGPAAQGPLSAEQEESIRLAETLKPMPEELVGCLGQGGRNNVRRRYPIPMK